MVLDLSPMAEREEVQQAMSDTLTMTGQITIAPDSSQSDAQLSGDFEIRIPLSLSRTLEWKEAIAVDVIPPGEGGDATTSVDTGGQDILIVRTTTPIVVTFDGEEGYTIPVEDFAIITGTTGEMTLSGYAVTGVVRIVAGREEA